MKYLNANDIFPDELLAEIQKYSSGELIYIPESSEKKKAWGEKSGSRDFYIKRNAQIRQQHNEGKTKVQEVRFKKPESEEDKKNQEKYFRKIFDYGKAEYEKGFRSIHENQINKLDRKAVDQNTLEIMGHYLNAIKCFGFILKNCTDKVLVDSVEFEYHMLQDYNAKLAKTLLNNNENVLMVKLI